MSKLREAAQAALNQWDKVSGVFRMTAETEALRVALAQPEPVVIGPEWTPCVKLPVTVHVREQRPGEQHVSTREGIAPVKPDDLIMRGVAGEEYPIGRELFEKTYRIGAHPPRNEWREAVHDELVTTWTLSAENKDDPRKALQDIINWHVRVSLDPAVSSDAQALIERGKAMRDEWRPASEREMLELAAKALGMPEAPKQYRIADGLPIVITYMGKPWNPLTDDGDALRLAVELRIKVEFGNDEVATDWPVSERYTTRTDGASSIEGRCAATRRAIVRAAAEIGRQMEETT